MIPSYRNSTYATYAGLKEALTRGEVLTVRGSEVAELRNRCFSIDKPLERCIVMPHRQNNIALAVVESLWVLNGRDDVATLLHYLPRAADFSDDGKIWRAAYGPRLRNWRGIDQLRETIRLFRNELGNRRAAMSLFDPALDYVDSKDIPCNNWIHWLARDGKLHMNVAIRSNDIVWGFSGINAFEWSILHELMSRWIGMDVGEATYFASSFHLYSRHYERAKRIVSSFPHTTCYEFGVQNPQCLVGWEELDEALETWFEIEQRSRSMPAKLDKDIDRFPDPLLKQMLSVVQCHNGLKAGWSYREVEDRISAWPETDLTVAAYDFLQRLSRSDVSNIHQPGIKAYWDAMSDKEPASLVKTDSLAKGIIALHREKTQAYGNSWKKRGEQIGILANIARKVDRLERVCNGGETTRDESLLDTANDLLVYSVKYETFLADQSAAAAAYLFDQDLPSIERPISDGLSGFEFLIPKRVAALDKMRYSLSDEIEFSVKAFGTVEHHFESPIMRRTENAVMLSAAAARLVVAVASTEPDSWREFVGRYASGGVK